MIQTDNLQKNAYRFYSGDFATDTGQTEVSYGLPSPFVEVDLDDLVREAQYAVATRPSTIDAHPKQVHRVVHLDRNKANPAVAGFPNLQRVTWSETKGVTLPKEIAALPTLRVLGISGNQYKALPRSLRHATRLSGLLLTGLTRLRSLSGLEQLIALEHLQMYNLVKLNDFSQILELPRLRAVSVVSMNLRQMCPVLAQLEVLERLDLSSSATFDVDYLTALLQAHPGLEELGLKNALLEHEPPPNLPSLRVLSLSGARRLPSDFLTGMPSLEVLDLSWPGPELPASLGSLARLQSLDIGMGKYTAKTDFSVLTQLTRLRDLHFMTHLERLPEAVGAIESLRHLQIGVCHELRDVSALRSHPNLEVLDLGGFSDSEQLIDVAMTLPKLEYLRVKQRTDITRLADHPSLKVILGQHLESDDMAALFDVHRRAHYPRRL